MTLRFLTSGESHGRGYLIVVEGLPAGLSLPRERFVSELARRRRGFGRGPRMALERDELTFWGGLRDGLTTGVPLGLSLDNSEWESWRPVLDPESVDAEAAAAKAAHCPRPGHADLPGLIKYGHGDCRDVLERASARATAAWTVVGVVGRLLLETVGVTVRGAVETIGGVACTLPADDEGWSRAASADLGCARAEDEPSLIGRITAAGETGETLGGTFVVSVTGMPPGVGSYAELDRRLDGRFAGALAAIPGIKGVEVGLGFRLAGVCGSEAHDEIIADGCGTRRRTNRAGGLEGGMTNGEEILLRAAMKPIPTLRRPLASVDLRNGKARSAHVERGDVCAVPAAVVVAEALAAWTAAAALAEQFGGDTVAELVERLEAFRRRGEIFHDRV
ncbi:MAG: chorismate synthase [Synergistales bacterium]|nr:chorismate synthase [Synergistales bacterium]